MLLESARGYPGLWTGTVSGLDIVTGKRVWQSPRLLGELRDIAYVDDGKRTRWAIATSYGMYVTR